MRVRWGASAAACLVSTPGLLLFAKARNFLSMKTLTVIEASQSLADWLRRAVGGEQIAICEGNYAVLLQPLPQSTALITKPEGARQALRQLQSESHLTSADAENYLREVRDERQAEGGSDRQ